MKYLLILSLCANFALLTYNNLMQAETPSKQQHQNTQGFATEDGEIEEDDYTRGFHAAIELFYNDQELYQEQVATYKDQCPRG